MTRHLPFTYHEDRLRHDGTRIFYRTWRPTGALAAALVICPGFNSHSGQYAEPAEALASAGLLVRAVDLRGRGRSDGPRFRVSDIAEYVSDLAAVIEATRLDHPDLPIVLLGHSAGGVVSVTYALDHGATLAGLICESFAYRIPAPRAALTAIKGLARFFPGLPAVKLKTRDFSRDPAVRDRLDADPMILNETQPAITVAAMIRANDRLERDFGHIRLPLLILHGTADRVTLATGSTQFARAAGSVDKTIKLYDGHVHDLLADTGGADVLDDILSWIRQRIAF